MMYGIRAPTLPSLTPATKKEKQALKSLTVVSLSTGVESKPVGCSSCSYRLVGGIGSRMRSVYDFCCGELGSRYASMICACIRILDAFAGERVDGKVCLFACWKIVVTTKKLEHE